MATRNASAGKGRPWTIKELESIPADWHGDTLHDGEGLSGEVRIKQNGEASVRFKYAFRWNGKVAWFQCGTWPKNKLAEIRRNRDDARDKVKAGIHPTTAKQADAIRDQADNEAVIAQAAAEKAKRKTVQDLFDVWIIEGVNRKDGNVELARLFNRDILPTIGGKPISDLTESDLRALLRPILAEGKVRKAQTMLLGIKQAFAWAEKRKPWRSLLIDGNPADLISEDSITPPDYEYERDRVLSPAEIRELAEIFTRTRQDYEATPGGRKYQAIRPMKRETELALWICLGTLCRIGELLMSEWRHVDLEAGIWFIPRENVKGRRGKKQDHHVHLSEFTRRQFVELKQLTGDSRWLFPARNKPDQDTHVCHRSVSKQVGDRQEQFMQRAKPLSRRRHDNTLVLAAGANGEWTPHDLRRTGATMMQQLGVLPDVIDRCQNHVIAGSKVRRHYLHHDYKDEKATAWSTLGERLDAILAGGAEIIQLAPRTVNE